MINIKDKRDCCGCHACSDVCPKDCISMVCDEEGFLYPNVELSQCVDCGLCNKVCPIIGANELKNIEKDNIAYAYVNDDADIVKASSSGGAFSLIMDSFASKYNGNYRIVGAALKNNCVMHTIVSSRNDANIFKKSKYIQSHTGGIFKEIKKLLRDGVYVLFSGTPCQVAGLKRFLGANYDNLLTVDIVCHGVPSQTIFNEYITEIENDKGCKIANIEFKYKKNFDGPKPNPRTVSITFVNGETINTDIETDKFLYAYHTGLIYRPSCEKCRFACSDRPGDITLGDYWGIEKIIPEFNSLKGISLVRLNTDKGLFMLDDFRETGSLIKTPWSFACQENHQLAFPAKAHRNRSKFFNLRKKGISFSDNVMICKKPDNLFLRLRRALSFRFNQIFDFS